MYNYLWYKILPMMISFAFSYIISFKIDKKLKLTDKVSAIIPMKRELKAQFCVGCIIIINAILGVLSTDVFIISRTLYFVICGIVIGIGIQMANRITVKKE